MELGNSAGKKETSGTVGSPSCTVLLNGHKRGVTLPGAGQPDATGASGSWWRHLGNVHHKTKKTEILHLPFLRKKKETYTLSFLKKNTYTLSFFKKRLVCTLSLPKK